MNQHAGYKCTHGMPITDGHTSTSHTTVTQVSKPEQATEPWSILRISQVKKCERLDPQSWDQSHSCMDQYQQQHQPQQQVLKLKMYRSTVLGSKVYMHTDPQSWDQRHVYIDKQSWDQRHMYRQTVIGSRFRLWKSKSPQSWDRSYRGIDPQSWDHRSMYTSNG